MQTGDSPTGRKHIPFAQDTSRGTVISRLRQLSGLAPAGNSPLDYRDWMRRVETSVGRLANPDICWGDTHLALGSTGFEVAPRVQLLRPPPVWIGSPDSRFPENARFGRSQPAASASLVIWPISGGAVYCIGRFGQLILDRDGNAIDDASCPLARAIHFLDVDISVAARSEWRRLPGTALTLLDHIWEPNFAHALLDALPRFGLSNPDAGLTVVVGRLSHSWQRQILAAAGIEPTRILELEPFQGVTADRLLVPSNIGGAIGYPALFGHPDAIAYLRSVSFRHTRPCTELQRGTRFLIVSRRRERGRALENEETVVAEAMRRGFVVRKLELEGLSVYEQWQAFREADVVLAVHGAALANIIAMRSGTSVVELLPPSYANPGFWMLAGACGVKYFGVTSLDVLDMGLRPMLRSVRLQPGVLDAIFGALASTSS